MSVISVSKRKFLIFMPFNFHFEATGNQYTEIMVDLYKNLGYETLPIKKHPIKSFGRLLISRRNNISAVNWIESQLTRGGKFRFFGVIKYLFLVVVFHILSKKVIYIRHNNYPHGTLPDSVPFVTRVADFLERFCFDVVYVHSRTAVKAGRKYLPHPLYRIPFESSHVVGEAPYLCFFGGIQRYKKIEELIKSWTRPEHLIIAGSCKDMAYRDELIAISRTKNITIIAERITDEHASSLLQNSQGSIILHGGEDMIVSGSLYYALSLGVSCICVNSPHARSLQKEGVEGVWFVENFRAINDLRLGDFTRLARSEIRASAESHFGDDVIAGILKNSL